MERFCGENITNIDLKKNELNFGVWLEYRLANFSVNVHTVNI